MSNHFGQGESECGAEEPSLPVPSDGSCATLQSKYPGIRDYDALRYMQLNHRFSDFVFLDATWKAMQAAGWTYHSTGGTNGCSSGHACYQSPGGTRQWTNPNDVQSALDVYAVRPILSNLQFRHVSPDRNDGDEGKECLLELRNTICYHVRLLVEGKRGVQTDVDPTLETTLTCDDNINVNTTDVRQRRDRRSKTPISSTAIEKGSDLYLHKNGRRQVSKKKQKASNNYAGQDVPTSFPTLSECANLLNEHAGNVPESNHREAFACWRHYLSTNHSLLLYGNGSKCNLLRHFSETELTKEGYVLEIDGYDPDVSIDSILDLLVTLFLHGQEPDFNTSIGLIQRHQYHIPEQSGICIDATSHVTVTSVERAVAVSRALCHECATATSTSTTYLPVFLVIHSLDGPGLSTEMAQDALAALVINSVPSTSPVAILRLVASIDHVDAPAALWSATTAASFSWIWQKVYTYEPYIRELSMLEDEDGPKKKASSTTRPQNQPSKLQETRVEEILRHLAPRYGEVLQLLAKLQLKELQAPGHSSWVLFQTFKAACKANFIIDKDSKLRALLTELTDHKMVVCKSSESQSECVTIPFSLGKLKEIAAYKR
jgi:origin recognition complex subunit 2